MNLSHKNPSYGASSKAMGAATLQQTVFGLYEIFGNIIPGTILLVSGLYLLGPLLPPSPTPFSSELLLIFIVFVAYAVGFAIQALSASLEKFLNKRKYKDAYPSSRYLNAADQTFPSYFKNRVRELLSSQFGTPNDAAPDHIFSLCYTWIMQGQANSRVKQFLNAYTFSRNMMVAMLIEGLVLTSWAFFDHNAFLGVLGIASFGLVYVFYLRFVRYSESFAKEVLMGFVVGLSSGISRTPPT